MNPFTLLPKLIKSKKPVEQIELNFNEAKMSGWKNLRTTVPGILLGLLMLAKIWAPASMQTKIDDTQKALVVIGLINAADAVRTKKSNDTIE